MENDEIKQIFQAVEQVTGIPREAIVTRSRIRERYFARMLVAHHLRERGYTYSEIARLVGVTGHASVVHQCRGYVNERTPYFRRNAEDVERILQNNDRI